MIVNRETAAVRAHLILIASATLLFAPVLAEGRGFGIEAYGANAPVGMQVLIGAFMFGLGMQLGNLVHARWWQHADGRDNRILLRRIVLGEPGHAVVEPDLARGHLCARQGNRLVRRGRRTTRCIGRSVAGTAPLGPRRTGAARTFQFGTSPDRRLAVFVGRVGVGTIELA